MPAAHSDDGREERAETQDEGEQLQRTFEAVELEDLEDLGLDRRNRYADDEQDVPVVLQCLLGGLIAGHDLDRLLRDIQRGRPVRSREPLTVRLDQDVRGRGLLDGVQEIGEFGGRGVQRAAHQCGVHVTLSQIGLLLVLDEQALDTEIGERREEAHSR
jgi:hypothetical protein